MRRLPSSLTGRLVATLVALVVLVTLLVTVVTSLTTRGFLHQGLDDDVDQALARSVPRSRELDATPPPLPAGGRGDFRPGAGDAAGTLNALLGGPVDRGFVATSTGGVRELSSTALEQLARVPADGGIHSVDLAGVGGFRVETAHRGEVTLVAGVSTRDVESLVGRLVLWEVLIGLGAVALAVPAGRYLVRRQLAPLRDVAATAHEVAELPLSTGAIGTTVRVREDLTDERTEVGRVGSALNTMLAHVEHALDDRHRSEQQVRQFVADASHELRTPLTTIHGYAELSRRTTPPDAGQLTHAMGKVEAEATRMSSLVEDLLLLARLDAGRPLAREEVDLTRLVLETVGDARVVGPDHRWLLDLPDEPVVVTGDEQRLHQVLTNLLTNARRHTPPGTTVTVGVRGTAGGGPGDVVQLDVSDDGPGMPADLVGHAFERFTRGDSSRTRESGGAGLGLSLVQAITTAHGGEASVESGPGRTVFAVRLPSQVADRDTTRVSQT